MDLSHSFSSLSNRDELTPRRRPIDGRQKFLGEDYATLVLVSGGSGVSYGLSNALDIVRRARAMNLGHLNRGIAVATQRLSFNWMVKTPGALFSPHFFPHLYPSFAVRREDLVLTDLLMLPISRSLFQTKSNGSATTSET